MNFDDLINNYPKSVSKILINLFSDVDDILKFNNFKKYSIYLIGSTSRGELSFSVINKDKIIFYSDVEFIIISNKWKLPSKIKFQIQDLLKNYKKKLNLIIDYGYYSKAKLFFSPNSVWKYEFYSNGILITGSALKFNKIRFLCKRSIYDLNYIRIWHTFNSLNRELENLHYHIARNSLDFLTIYTYLNNMRLNSFQKRDEYIRNIDKKNELSKFKIFFIRCFEIKKNPMLKFSSGDKKILLEFYYIFYLNLIDHKKNDPSFLNFIKYYFRMIFLKYKLLNIMNLYVFFRSDFSDNLFEILLLLFKYSYIKPVKSDLNRICYLNDRLFKKRISVNGTDNEKIFFSIDNVKLYFKYLFSY